jgi:hypothetical protein
MCRRSALAAVFAVCGTLGITAAGAASAAEASYAPSLSAPRVLVVRQATECTGFCRAWYPPCRVGRRWYGPYGYVCYRSEPGSVF